MRVTARLIDLVRDEQWAEALEVLLADFRATPAHGIAAAIRAVDARALVTTPVTFGASDGARAKKILARIPVATAAERGRILDEIKAFRLAIRLERIEAMRASHGDDPRISDIVCAIAEHVVTQRSSKFPEVWPRLWALIEQSGGIRERILALPPGANSPWPPEPGSYEAARAHALSVIPETPVLADAERACYREIVQLAGSLHARDERRERERTNLLAAIYADPAATGPKAVYADWLQQHGDPRGEFIALQLASDSFTAKERALIRLHDKDWRHPFGPGAGHVEYRDGFPIRAAYHTGPIDEDPAWATVVSATSVPASDRAHVPMLTELRELGDGDVYQLTRLTRPLAVTSLHWRQSPQLPWNTGLAQVDVFDELDRITVLPALRTLHLVRWVTRRSQIERVLASKLGRQLEHLSVDLAVADLAHVVELLAPLELETATLLVGPAVLKLAGTTLTGRLDGRNHAPELAQLLAELERLPAGRITSVELEPDTLANVEELAARLRRALRHQSLTTFRLDRRRD